MAWAYVGYSLLLLRWHYQQYIIVRQHYLRKGGPKGAGRWAACTALQLTWPALQVVPPHVLWLAALVLARHAEAAPAAGGAAGDDANYWRELHLPQRKPRHSTHHRLGAMLRLLHAQGQVRAPPVPPNLSCAAQQQLSC